MELAYRIGLCERNQLLVKPLVFWLFGFSQPNNPTLFMCRWETGVSVISSSRRADR